MSASHEISANCLRKCTAWQLQLNMPKEKFIKHQYLTIEPNNGIALKQMNYHYEKGCSKAELNKKKANSKLPSGPQPFNQDLLDDMIAHEDTLIFSKDSSDFHDKNCRRDGKCCEIKIRNFNCFARQAYEK